ncbi:acyl-CoA thioesterase domain-containing protein [Fodinicola feengrottensis]|uniref:acyl-CoA thioesterase domain-containing protein n=1 Tax=Fodinicola feengrottensis TaxID=435914 RepID=UPI0024425F4F|nr:acyl-CoA thioesterase domain-containing protein [Fodinicola feengrottensis]
MVATRLDGSVTIDRSWWSAAGAHGGLLASLGLRAMESARRTAAAYEQPVRSLTTHYLASVDERALSIEPAVQRVGRGSSIVTFQATQGKNDGDAGVGHVRGGTPRAEPRRQPAPGRARSPRQ